MFEPSQVLRWISSNFRHWCRWHGRSDLLQCCSSPDAWKSGLFHCPPANVILLPPFLFPPCLGQMSSLINAVKRWVESFSTTWYSSKASVQPEKKCVPFEKTAAVAAGVSQGIRPLTEDMNVQMPIHPRSLWKSWRSCHSNFSGDNGIKKLGWLLGRWLQQRVSEWVSEWMSEWAMMMMLVQFLEGRKKCETQKRGHEL